MVTQSKKHGHDSQKIYRFSPCIPEIEDKEIKTNSKHKEIKNT